MSKNLIRKILAFLMTLVMTICLVNVNTTRADVEAPDENKYASILPLFKTIDETIHLLIERADKGELEDRTYFVKSNSETLDTSGWGNIIDKSLSEDIRLRYWDSSFTPLTFKYDGMYYHIIRLGIVKARPIREEHRKETVEKAKHIEESLGLFSNELCDYEKAAILFRYVVNNVKYNHSTIGIYHGQTAYEGLVLGKAVCAGYARTYNALLKDVGVESLYVTSFDCIKPHAWNLVKLDNTWYFCDAVEGIGEAEDYNEYCFLYGFMFGSDENSTIAFHEIDKITNDTMQYYKCSISKDDLFTRDNEWNSPTLSLCRMYDYKEPSCTESGGYRIECDYCNSEHTITIPPTHYYTYTTTKEPTCNEAGSCTATCTLCGHSKEESIPQEEHSWDYRYKETTCKEDGYEKVWCEKCDKYYWGENTKASGHDWGEWKFTHSYSKWDYYERECSNCGKIDNKEDEVLYRGPSDDLIKKDRGYGIIAYYKPESGCWCYIHEEFGEAATYPNVRVWSSLIGEYVTWDDTTHTFKRDSDINPTTEAPATTTQVEPTTPKATTNPTTTKPNATTKAPKKTTTKKTTTTKQTTTVKKPGKVKKVKVKASKKAKKRSLKISWKKALGANKYQVQICTSDKFKKSVIKKTTTKTKYTINGLKANKRYYIRVRAIKISKKKNIYGNWSDVVNKKTKK